MKEPAQSALAGAWDSFWRLLQPLLTEHAFLTIICAFFAIMMTLSCYRLLKSISPGLVAFIFLLIFGMLILHWTFTRTEPAFLKPAIDYIAPFFPSAPQYPEAVKTGKPVPPPAGKPAPKKTTSAKSPETKSVPPASTAASTPPKV